VRPETAAKIIGQIYDCVFRPEGWPQLLKAISTSGENAGSSIVVHDRWGLGRGFVFEHGADQSHLRLYFEKLAASKAVPASRIQLHSVGEVTTLTMLCGEKELAEHDFYVRWVKPSGFRDMIGVLVLKSGQRLAWFSVARTEIQAPYGDWDMKFMDCLAPHICRAFTMADAFEMQAIKLQQLEQTVEALNTSVFLADRRGVTYMNSSAKRLVDQGRVLKIKNNQLTAAKPRMTDILNHALAASVGGTAPSRAGSHVVALPGEEGGGLLASILPLNWREARNPLSVLPGAAAIFIQDLSQAPEPASQAFAKLYGLTPAELRVSLGIAEGKSLQELTDTLNISANTAKTHLKHIFAKTGVTRQGDLVRLVMLSTPPLRSAVTS
jgi:DNA-binding CsgD family transcriptional regulator